MQATNWVKTSDKLPAIGVPTIVVCGEYIQEMTYELIHCDNTNELRWFPYNNSDFDSAPLETFDYWLYIKKLPKPPALEAN